jgi:hypothetical protein
MTERLRGQMVRAIAGSKPGRPGGRRRVRPVLADRPQIVDRRGRPLGLSEPEPTSRAGA